MEIIEVIHEEGGRIWLEGGKVKAHLPKSLLSLVDVIRSEKEGLLEALALSPDMPLGVRLVRWKPKEPPVMLSNFETVTDIDPFVSSTLRQVASRLSGHGWRAGNWTLSTLIDRLAAVGCFVELVDRDSAVH